MACEAVVGLALKPGRTVDGLIGQSNHLLRDPPASDLAQQAALISSSLFNHGDPDLSFCDVLADAIETESDKPSTVNVEEFTDLMLFPELQGVFEIDDFPVFQDFPFEPLGGVDGMLKPTRETIPSIATVADSNGEISPAESDASVEHFFNTFTDLTRFLDKLEEAGPSDFNDVATFIAESNKPFGNDAEPSGTATMTTLPTSVGSETASNDEIRVDPTGPTKMDSEAPPTKRARTSHSKPSKASAEQKYRHRRDKNNVASQRSRASRKVREKSMAVKAKELEADNERLRKRIDELSVIAEEARKCLVESLSQK
ncbi:CCAAT/enhancer-binding protein beta-like [Asterias rubens]|uniref:CCAAT/enhancer-binding protein beta-like n=1 Tax=Asterias rubens TaxID=7604 RepID=UPI001455CC4C|nr:CCAAT/enhancer-binding protein beta-like [Asterias rubens]